MKVWKTEILAIDPVDGKAKMWPGFAVLGETRLKAQENCRLHGHGYLRVTELIGEFVGEIENDDIYHVTQN